MSKGAKFRVARIIIGLIFFVAITLSFQFFSSGKLQFTHEFASFQFGPSLMALFAGSALPFIVIMLITLIFGRVYCSFMCPLGIWQDIVTWIAARFKSKKQRRFDYKKPHNILRFSILTVVAISLIIGISYPFALLDPYSVFGRIASNLFSGALQGINNLLANLFPSAVSYEPYAALSLWTMAVAIAFFSLVTILSAFWGRIYCNSVCPVGSFLGLLGKYSMFRMEVNESKCKECGLCRLYCKSECLDSKNKHIDYSRCVVCFNCMKACRENAMEFRFAWRKPKSKEECKVESQGRRDALIALGTVGAVVASRKWGKKFHSAPAEESGAQAIVPPGGVSIDHLKEHCTACQACVAACPSKIIRPAVGEYGVDGFMMPTLTYDKHFCNYDCNKCSSVCPNGALLHTTLEEKKLTQIGVVNFIAKNCIVFKDGTDCGACNEHCPTKAIEMVEHKKKPGLYYPTLHKDICIGCGACEYSCPAAPKAMVIVPNAVHAKANKPSEDKQEEKIVTGFGF